MEGTKERVNSGMWKEQRKGLIVVCGREREERVNSGMWKGERGKG